MSQRNQTTRGFTLIELLFAMSFVSVLLILILTATIQMTRIYNKGITLKQVNQAGAAIGSELQTAMKASDPLTPAAKASVAKGRLCLGTYSYVWNLQGATMNRYTSGTNPIGLVKVSDATGAMCSGTPNVPNAQATEMLLNAGGNAGAQLQLRDFAITQTANNGGDYVYNVSYTISTGDQSLINASANACAGGASDEFCALNSFNFDIYMRKGGSGN